MPATCMAQQVCSTECTAMRRRDYVQPYVKCCSGIRPVQEDSMHSAAASTSLPNCICLCDDSVCTNVVYCIDGTFVYQCICFGCRVLRLCRTGVCATSNAYVCLGVCSNLNLHVAHYKSVQVIYIIEMRCYELSKHAMPTVVIKRFVDNEFGPNDN